MPTCKSSKYVGRDVILEFAIGCGDTLPTAGEWMRLGAMRAKNWGVEWETADATADDSIGSLRENLATFQALSMGGDGISKVSGAGSESQKILTKHVVNPIATGGQPSVWMRMTFPDLTFTAFMLVTTMNRDTAYDDVVPFSMEASSTASDFGLIVEDTPDPDAAPVASVDVFPTAASLGVGAQTQLAAIVLPVGSASGVVWSSATPAVATVSQSGVVTAVATGSAVITAASAADATKTDTSTITVA